MALVTPNARFTLGFLMVLLASSGIRSSAAFLSLSCYRRLCSLFFDNYPLRKLQGVALAPSSYHAFHLWSSPGLRVQLLLLAGIWHGCIQWIPWHVRLGSCLANHDRLRGFLSTQALQLLLLLLCNQLHFRANKDTYFMELRGLPEVQKSVLKAAAASTESRSSPLSFPTLKGEDSPASAQE